jgi:hypothetical protein
MPSSNNMAFRGRELDPEFIIKFEKKLAADLKIINGD